MHVLNFCVLYANYYIYIQSLFNNNMLDLYACMTQLKQELTIVENICIKIIMKKNFTNSTLSMKKCKPIMTLMHVTTSIGTL